MAHYKLKTTLIGHSQDVRSITVTKDSEIITVSRDGTGRLWTKMKDNDRY